MKDEPDRPELLRQMRAAMRPETTWRARIQDRIVELMIRLGRLLSKLRRPR